MESDGYHTFDELYYHRTILFSVICNANPAISWKAKKHYDGSSYDGYFIAGINTPAGTYSYHCELIYWKKFKIPILDKAPEWDGHMPKDVDRLESL